MSSKRVTMALILGSTILPIVLAVGAYFGGWGPSGSNAKGELLSPVLTIEQWGGEELQFTGVWSILKTQAGPCDQLCNERLESLRRVHDALGRESTRVQVVDMSSEKINLEPGIWVVDPLGNLVMRYDANQELKALLDDLRKLLKVSRIG